MNFAASLRFAVLLHAVALAVPSPLAAQATTTPRKGDPVIVTPEAVDGAVRNLEKALFAGTTDDKIKLIRDAARLDQDKVATMIGRGLADKEIEVRKAAILGLRYMTCPAALTQLLGAAERFQQDEELGPAWYLALGQSGNEKVLSTLLDGSWHDQNSRIFEARMSAVAHVRSTKSIEGLLDLLNKSRRPGDGRGGMGNRSGMIERALRLLSDTDEPRTMEEWRAWWRDHRATFKVSKEPTNGKRGELSAYRQQWRDPHEADGKDGKDGKDAKDGKEKGKDAGTDGGGNAGGSGGDGKGEGEGKGDGGGESPKGRRRGRKGGERD